jgi:hypothetical protein
MTISTYISGDTITVTLTTTNQANVAADPDGDVMLTLYESGQVTVAVAAAAMTRIAEASFTHNLTLPEGTGTRTYYAKARWTTDGEAHDEGITVRTAFANS